MDEQQVRALVRKAIARHMGAESDAAPAAWRPAPAFLPPSVPLRAPAVLASDAIVRARFHLERPAGEVECLIEPAVTCNHCGYCQCYGH